MKFTINNSTEMIVLCTKISSIGLSGVLVFANSSSVVPIGTYKDAEEKLCSGWARDAAAKFNGTIPLEQ